MKPDNCFSFAGLVAVISMLCLSMACNAVSSITGQCHDDSTGEVLEEVEDADGNLWPVKRHPDTLRFAGQEYEMCAVSIEAPTHDEGSMLISSYVFHPRTGEKLRVGGMTSAKGMQDLNGYEWY